MKKQIRLVLTYVYLMQIQIMIQCSFIFTFLKKGNDNFICSKGNIRHDLYEITIFFQGK